jgi:23S rRNA (uracil1939-C5)-methyltransferase
VEFAEPKALDRVLDLFCGTGTIGMFFAKLGCSVTGIELNKDAIENAIANAKLNTISHIQFIGGDIFKVLTPQPSTLTPQPSILITDPPRAGIAQKSLEKIIVLKIPKWIYVSCNPTTLSRDLKIICETGGYKLKKNQPVDMFPHTYHVETVCLLER